MIEAQYGIYARPGQEFDVYTSLQHKRDAGIKSVVPYSAGYNIKIAVRTLDEKGLETLEKMLKADPRIAIVSRLDGYKLADKSKGNN